MRVLWLERDVRDVVDMKAVVPDIWLDREAPGPLMVLWVSLAAPPALTGDCVDEKTGAVFVLSRVACAMAAPSAESTVCAERSAVQFL